ncbi:hypothetical protein [Henriciella sp.]|uniref:hypothetical protein n=1 Tax=Henriciella sp. TaxID=1968823 RepID=UPI002638A54C|nr:hypothetical protein [Henriciella sp.]
MSDPHAIYRAYEMMNDARSILCKGFKSHKDWSPTFKDERATQAYVKAAAMLASVAIEDLIDQLDENDLEPSKETPNDE